MKPKGKFYDRDKEESEAQFKHWLKESLSKNFPNEEFPKRLSYLYPNKPATKMVSATGCAGVASPREESFLYMDVGAWVGSKDGAWGKQAKYLKRDFGLVCGPYALLCTFEHAADGLGIKTDPDWERVAKAPGRSLALQSLIKLIKVLSAALPDKKDGLGEVVVRRFMQSSWMSFPGCNDEKSWTIYVILGDMHIPVIDEQTYARGIEPTGDKAGDELAENDRKLRQMRPDSAAGGMLAPLVVRQLPDQPRVRRFGRVDLGALEALVDLLVGSGKDGAQALENLVKVLNVMAVALNGAYETPAEQTASAVLDAHALALALALAPVAGVSVAVLADTISRCADPVGVANDSMTLEQAKRWFEYYRKGRGDEKYPADIFESAGEHLLGFVNAVCSYEKGRGESDLGVRFCQLGDLLDFWVGFTCHYKPSGSNLAPVNPAGSKEDWNRKTWYGTDLMDHWTKTALATKEGKHLFSALVALKEVFPSDSPRRPIFLYGNHDNYFGNRDCQILIKGQEKPSVLWNCQGRLDKEHGVFMEHGHQWEDANADNASTWGFLSAVTGTGCPTGLLVTQAAFLRPHQIRGFEGKAAGLGARFAGVFGQRLTQVAFAADRLMEQKEPFHIYVMGHTHDACLTRVVVETGSNPSPAEQFRKNAGKSEAFVWLGTERADGPGMSVRLDAETWAPSGEAASIAVSWAGMAGLDGYDWISLEDPLAPPGTYAKGLWFPLGNGKQRGNFTVCPVPPGRYEARAYFGPKDEDKTIFKTSSNRYSVEGISVEGDANSSTGDEFFVVNGMLNRPVVLRWAYGSEWIERRWFSIFRKGESAQVDRRPKVWFTSIGSGLFPEDREARAARAARGRWVLDSGFTGHFIASPGEWEVRAYLEKGGPTLCGLAKLKISGAK